jgi:hypothetical protein
MNKKSSILTFLEELYLTEECIAIIRFTLASKFPVEKRNQYVSLPSNRRCQGGNLKV